MIRRLPITLITLLAALTTGCFGLPVSIGGGQPLTCDALGVGEDAARIETFLETSERFERDAWALADELEATCAVMAADLDVAVPRATEGQLQVDATCRALATEIDAIVVAATPDEASFVVTFDPPVCEVDLDAMASCVATCDVDLEASATVECTDSAVGRSCYGDESARADAQCESVCEARVDLSATCTEPTLEIQAGLAIDLEDQVRLDTLIDTLHANYPRFLALEAQLGAVAESGAELAASFEGAADATGRLGLYAMACVADASATTLESLNTIQVSVSVTVEVSASVSSSEG